MSSILLCQGAIFLGERRESIRRRLVMEYTPLRVYRFIVPVKRRPIGEADTVAENSRHSLTPNREE